MNFDRTLSIITGAALIGLLILNYNAAAAIFKGLSDASTGYIKAVQGR